MKKISRMILFSALSLYISATLNKSFILANQPEKIIYSILLIASIYYIITPILRIIFLPINLLTIGTFSAIVYFLIFNYLIDYFGLIQITQWTFPGLDLGFLIIPKMIVSELANKIFAAFLISFIISLLEFFL
jgi:uncharacterized membrane protein YvlD (DUF360 family)